MDREGYARRKRDSVGFEWKGGRDFKRERLGHGGGTKYSWDGIDGNVLEVHDHLFFAPLLYQFSFHETYYNTTHKRLICDAIDASNSFNYFITFMLPLNAYQNVSGFNILTGWLII